MKTKNAIIIGLLLVLCVIGGAFGGKYLMSTGNVDDKQLIVNSKCGSDLKSSWTITAYNGLNDSGLQSRDQTAYVYSVVNGVEQRVATLSDLTAGTLSSGVDCGSTYRIRLVSASGKGTLVDKVIGGKVVDGGKAVEIIAGVSNNVEITTKDVSGVKVKVYDNNLRGDVYDGSDAVATDYETTTATFKSTTNNATAMAIGLGESLDVTMNMKAVTAYNDVADLGMYILIDAPTSEYETPVVKLNGNVLSEATGLSASEDKAYSAYEYIYKVNAVAGQALIAYNTDTKLQIEMGTVSSVDASTDVVVAIAPIGGVQDTTSSNMVYGSVDNSASRTAVYALQTFTLDLS